MTVEAKEEFDKQADLMERAEQGDTSAIVELLQYAAESEDDELWKNCKVLVELVTETLQSEIDTLKAAVKENAALREKKRALNACQEGLRQVGIDLKPGTAEVCPDCGEKVPAIILHGVRLRLCSCLKEQRLIELMFKHRLKGSL